MNSENSQEAKKIETAKNKAEGLDLKEARELIESNSQEDLQEFIEFHDEIEKKAEEGIEDPAKKEEIDQENALMRKQAEESWKELQDTMKKAQEGKGDENPSGEAAEKEAQRETAEEAEQTEESAAQEKGAGEPGGENDEEDRELSKEDAVEGAEYVIEIEEIIDQFAGEDRSEKEKEIKDRFENAEDKGAVIEDTRQQYADKLGLKDYKSDEEEKKRFEQLQDDIARRAIDSRLAKGLEKKEEEFSKIIEEGQELIQEGNAEKVGAYFEEMAGTLDDAADYLRTIYLKMEADPELRQALHEEYVSIVTSIQRFEEASEKLRGLIAITEKAREENRPLTEEEKSQMVGWLDYLKAIAVIMGAVGAALGAFYTFSKAAAASHPLLARSIGRGVIGGIGNIALPMPSAAIAAKYACILAGVMLVLNEEKRDAFVEKITGVKLPSWAKPKPKGEGKK